MKEIHIGTYPIYCSNVDLFAMPTSRGGSVNTKPDNKSLPKITVGFGYRDWEDAVSILLHESFEYCSIMMELQFNPSGSMIYDSSAMLFVFNHPQFTRVCEFQACFITRCLPDLSTAWKKCKKRK